MGDYDDIIHLPHHVSKRHPQMSMLSRAAQFAPFAALTGYDDAIRERGRETDEWREPGEAESEELNRSVARLMERIAEQPRVRVTFFRPDTETFRCLPLAYNAIEQGGNIPCVMNAANEVAVQRFIDGKLRFVDIAGFVEQAISKATYIAHPTLDQLLECDTETRKTCNNI